MKRACDRARGGWLLVVLSGILCGCPDSGGAGPSPTPSASASPTASATPADPLEGSLFSKDELFDLYRAQMQGPEDPASKELLTKHRLIDAAGQPVKARQEAYQRALKRFAERDPQGWSEFVDSLAR